MEPALDVIGRALQGDPGACSFLDRTSSIYVLDATDSSKPKTYGCWNFIHQAMNEVERYEANFLRNNQIHMLQNGAGLDSHVKLLATMALRVARRSPDIDRSLVSTCVVNAGSQFAGTAEQSRWLIDLNLELREIVMGRIAAMAFDFTFHKQDGPHGHSAFADPTVMEIFCAVLASNAVSSGPLAVRHFVTEWIVPSARTLPPFAVACVTLHLALAALRKAAPAGTKDTLQQLSASVVSRVLAPVFVDAVSEDASLPDNSEPAVRHEKNNEVAATCIRALDRWCAATDLSLAQIKHICSKAEINFVEFINDAMYSDSKSVVEALAEFIEAAILESDEMPTVLDERMTQVRYLLQVDEASFQANFSAVQLNMIESKEMSAIVEELMSAIGLQRFRFTERQNNHDHEICRSLVRIAAALSAAAMRSASGNGHVLKNEPGLIDLIMKGAAHPSVNISGIALVVLGDIERLDTSLASQLLPLLQRRAITPHHMISDAPCLAASDICGVNVNDFHVFRDTVLKGALIACYEGDKENYMESCTSAIEEFCSEGASSQVSLHLEAALFCLASVADDVLAGDEISSHSSKLERCTKALSTKPHSLMMNPLTLAQMCCFIRKYHRWYGEGQAQGVLDAATDLALSTFNICAASYPGGDAGHAMIIESNVSTIKEASLALLEILREYPRYFLSNSAITALGAGWEASYAACNRPDVITIDDRKALCIGICHVLAALPDNQRVRSFHALALPALDCFEKMTSVADTSVAGGKSQDQIKSILERLADEIVIFSTMARAFINACVANDKSLKGITVLPVSVPGPLVSIARKVWPSLIHVAESYCDDENVSSALGQFMIEFLPRECSGKDSISLMKEISSIAFSILKKAREGKSAKFRAVFEYLGEFVRVHGETVEKRALESNRKSESDTKGDVVVVLTDLLLAAVDEFQTTSAAKTSMNSSSSEQDNGQPPFESKMFPEPKKEPILSDEFCGMFSFFKVCVENCPSYFFQLPSAPGLEGQEDLLYQRSVETAIGFLIDSDVSIAEHAMDFLEILFSQANNENVRNVVLDTLSRSQPKIISMLILGFCGNLSYSILERSAQFLQAVIGAAPATEELRLSAISALKNEQFRLGDDARHIVLSVFEGLANGDVSVEKLKVVLEHMWELHQLEEIESPETCDVVARFVKQFRIC